MHPFYYARNFYYLVAGVSNQFRKGIIKKKEMPITMTSDGYDKNFVLTFTR